MEQAMRQMLSLLVKLTTKVKEQKARIKELESASTLSEELQNAVLAAQKDAEDALQN